MQDLNKKRVKTTFIIFGKNIQTFFLLLMGRNRLKAKHDCIKNTQNSLNWS